MPNFKELLEGHGLEESVGGTHLGGSESPDEDVLRARIHGEVTAC